ncbi:hypothetical protein [uncultured Polaribacter sp.]|uniref:hypothetical protein n=1 Tax=uncultured Polaribacter sp. TaxID=174711 RepID=UPI00259BF441|nr:hypothetical protein [uncultured Polaribacter sp.]
MIEKVCTKCKVKKNKLEFHKNKRSSDGLKSMCKKCKNQYYLDNSEKIKLKAKKRYIIKKDQIKEYQKIYKKNNREKINLRERNYKKKRRVNDEVYILKENLSCLIRNGLKLYNHKKNTKTLKILGLNFKDFKEYLNNNKYGFSYLDKDIDLDHIIPISKAKNKKEAIKLNHYTNFQLLPKDYNRNIKKDNLFDIKHFENWLINYKNK